MFKKFAVGVFSVLVLSSCGHVVTGGATMVGTAVVQERTIGAAIDDAAIMAKTKSEYLQEDVNNLFHSVNIFVHERRVLLTGTVPSNKYRIKAVKLAWKAKGVKEVINEIQIDSEFSAEEYAKDTWITTQIRSKMLLSAAVHSINYKVITVNKVVYLMGVAQTRSELDEVAYLASRVPNVQKVISHVRIIGQKIPN